MYYIIETEDQLNKFCSYDLEECVVDVIPSSDWYHNAITSISLVYIKPIKSKYGYILPLDHDESFKLSYKDIEKILLEKINTIYAIDLKRLKYFFYVKSNAFCLKTALYLKKGIVLTETDFYTSCHNLISRKFYSRHDLNKIIPVSKHYEKLEKITKHLQDLKDYIKQEEYVSFYTRKVINVLHYIEKQGICTDVECIKKYSQIKNLEASVNCGKVYSHYNINTVTGRPSNSYNGINFSALNKEDGSRKIIKASPGNVLVEFDYSSYHLRILCSLIDYKFEDSDIHTHLAKHYFKKDQISKEEYDESKAITFRLLYTDAIFEDAKNIPFISKVREYKEELWNKYNKHGFILSPISKKPISKIESKSKILPYILQTYETERNMLVLEKLFYFLSSKKSKVILYCYDSILFDFCKEDGESTLSFITNIIEEGGYKTSIKYGTTYHKMKIL